MNTAVVVTLENGRRITCPTFTAVGQLLPRPCDARGFPYLGCLINNEACSLAYPVTLPCRIRFLTVRDSLGMRIYRNSLAFLLAKAVAELFPRANFRIEHSLGTGFFCQFAGERSPILNPRVVRQIETHLRQLVAQNLVIEPRQMSFADALTMFEKMGRADKVNLLRFRNPPHLTIYRCQAFADLDHGPLAPATGVLSLFKLIPYPPGLILQFPDPDRPRRIAPFRDQPQLFRVFRDHKEWGRILGVDTVGKLNELIAERNISNFIRIEEAFHEKKIASLADQILARRRQVKVVLIAGPSAAGKTTLSKRLAVQLEVNGLTSIMISLDNYYLDDQDTPRGPDRRPDYEHLEAIDIALFNRHLLKLIAGREIELPAFNFKTKRREFRRTQLQLGPDQILIVEGIHGLNPQLTHRIAARHKFKIYISALTQLNIDANNRISTTDNRLMRRLVRDYTFRGNSALTTLRMWPSVRRGEKTWIFPFQAQADATFNSALDYELAVLKPLVEPLLLEIKPTQPEYAETRRLQEFLSCFLAVTKNEVPRTSILCEFIGASSFKY